MERGPALLVFRTKQPGLRHLAERYGAAGVTDDDGFTRYVARVVSGFVDRLRRICGDRWQQRHPEEAVNVCGGPSAVRGDLPSRQVGGRFELNGDGGHEQGEQGKERSRFHARTVARTGPKMPAEIIRENPRNYPPQENPG